MLVLLRRGGGGDNHWAWEKPRICIECPVFVQPIKNPCDYAPCMSNYWHYHAYRGGGGVLGYLGAQFTRNLSSLSGLHFRTMID